MKATQLSREDLYKLVWSEALRTIAPRYGISDVAFRKKCVAANVPTPPVGYWAKVQSGKKAARIPLPPRGFGQSNDVLISSDRYSAYRRYSIDEPPPEGPIFEESMDAVRQRAVAIVGKIKVPKDLAQIHPVIAQLLAEDDKRPEKAAGYSFTAPWLERRFDKPAAKRRLRLMNAILFGVARAGGSGWLANKDSLSLKASFGDTPVTFTVDNVPTGPKSAPAGEVMAIGIMAYGYQDKTAIRKWTDAADLKIEKVIPDVVVELMVTAESFYRHEMVARYRRLIVDREEVLEAARKARIEADRRERERLINLEQQRVDRLLGDAVALSQAMNIRAYVEAARNANSALPVPIHEAAFEQWQRWALAQADRIDPVANRKFAQLSKDELA